MKYRCILQEYDRLAARAQTLPHIDIFHGRSGEHFVESAHPEKKLLFNAEITGPQIPPLLIDGCFLIDHCSFSQSGDPPLQYAGHLIVKDTILIDAKEIEFRNTVVVEEDDPIPHRQ
jgi:hypothetical protein